jgi:hypothetical protein
MGECCKMFSGVLGKIKNFGWGLLNQTGRAPDPPGGSSRDAIRRRRPGTRAHGWHASGMARVCQWRLAARRGRLGAGGNRPPVGSAAQPAIAPPVANRDGQGCDCDCPDDDGDHVVRSLVVCRDVTACADNS